MDRQKTKHTGIYYREHPTRKNGLRKDKYFYLRYTLNGKQREEGFGWESEGKTEASAFTALNEIKDNIKKGSSFFSLKEKAEMAAKEKEEKKAAEAALRERNITFSQLWIDFYKPIYLAAKGAKTQQNEQINFDKHIEPIIGHICIYDITPSKIEQIKESMRKKELSAATINHVLACVRQAYNKAIDDGRFDGVNPAGNKVKRLKKDNRRIRFLSYEEAAELFKNLRQCKTMQLHDMALLGLNCGLRANEIFSLQLIDINFQNKTIAIRDPKGVFNRFAYMTAAVYEMLLERTAGKKLHDYIFTNAKGEKISEVSNQFDRIVNKIGLNDNVDDRRYKVVFHTLRHTFASWLAMKGVDVYTIKELMGHSDIKMTMRYMHLAPNKFSSAVAVLESTALPATDPTKAVIAITAAASEEITKQPLQNVSSELI